MEAPAATAARLQFLTRLAALVGARANDKELAASPCLRWAKGEGGELWKAAILEGLGQGMQNSGRSLREVWEKPKSLDLAEAVTKVRPFFEQAAATGARRQEDGSRPPRRDAVCWGWGRSPSRIPALEPLLTVRNSVEVQLAAVRALSLQDSPLVAGTLLTQWGGYSPQVRREVIEAMFARKDRLNRLLDAIERKGSDSDRSVPHGSVAEASRRGLRKRALALLAGQGTTDRRKVIDEYKPALDLKADAPRGKEVFKKVCATCHRLDNVGVEVGPDLLSALRNQDAGGPDRRYPRSKPRRRSRATSTTW